jgi:hypothetical protein
VNKSKPPTEPPTKTTRPTSLYAQKDPDNERVHETIRARHCRCLATTPHRRAENRRKVRKPRFPESVQAATAPSVGACLPPPPRAHVALRWSGVVAPPAISGRFPHRPGRTPPPPRPKGGPLSVAQIRLFPNSRAPPRASPLLLRTHSRARAPTRRLYLFCWR